jgi:hypothetical protein
MQVEVLHLVLEQEPGVALLDAPALRDVGQVADRPVQRQVQRREYVFPPPRRGDRLGCQLLCGVIAHLPLEAVDRGELRTEVGERLAKAGLSELSNVDGAEAAPHVIEAMAVFADLRRDEPERVASRPYPPVGAVRWILAHSWKLASWRAARMTAVNCSGCSAVRSTSIGASSSSRVFVPNSHALAVSAS